MAVFHDDVCLCIWHDYRHDDLHYKQAMTIPQAIGVSSKKNVILHPSQKMPYIRVTRIIVYAAYPMITSIIR